ncbi:hypothetical protein ACFORL_05680 [Legionella dresdenensis]|uniref:Substrate of the Dot/Icm secretion system n=1 Tax=Legionella dresdenensis TaxID=450200 RepID=A0ABV8CEI5_9GAMM
MNNEIQEETQPAMPEEAWKMLETFKDIFVHPDFFEKGLVVISPPASPDMPRSSETLRINEREYVIFNQNKEKWGDSPTPESRSINKTKKLATELSRYAKQQNQTDFAVHNNAGIYNKQRREEIFLPLTVATTDSSVQCYAYPWLGRGGNMPQFKGAARFVSAGCMFGATLSGKTNTQKEITLINHKLPLEKDEIITEVIYDKQSQNPFEETLFQEFEKTCCIIDALCQQNKPKQLLYHLPLYDYLLFGVKLVLQNRMTHDALSTLTKAVVEKAAFYRVKLLEICQPHNIELTITSPFEGLFTEFDPNAPAQSLWTQLGLATEEQSVPHDHAEAELTQSLLERLQTANHNQKQQQIWQTLVALEKNPITDIEGLFKVANAVILAEASQGQGDYETCSLLPLSEKQIQVQYDGYVAMAANAAGKGKKSIAAIVNITMFEPVITYSPTTKGLLFYMACCLKSLATLIKDHQILKSASQKLGLFASSSNIPTEASHLKTPGTSPGLNG